jgi:hypothetical protein
MTANVFKGDAALADRDAEIARLRALLGGRG